MLFSASAYYNDATGLVEGMVKLEFDPDMVSNACGTQKWPAVVEVIVLNVPVRPSDFQGNEI